MRILAGSAGRAPAPGVSEVLDAIYIKVREVTRKR